MGVTAINMRWQKTVIYENDEQFLRSFAIEPLPKLFCRTETGTGKPGIKDL